MSLRIVDKSVTPEIVTDLIDLNRDLRKVNGDVEILQADALSTSLLRSKFENRQRLFVAEENENKTAAVVARVSPTIHDRNGKLIGMLGFFQAINDPQAVAELLENAVQWLKAQQCTSIVGPIDGDTWHKYRFNVGPYRQAPFLLEPINPGYYADLWKGAEFELLESYHSSTIDDVEQVIPLIKPAIEAAEQQGFTFRPIDVGRFEDELRIIYRLSTTIFRENLLYDEILWEEFLELYQPARNLIHPRLIWFVSNPAGEEVGFLFCLIDYQQAVASMRGKRHLLAKLKFLMNRSQANAVNFKSIGILPAYRRHKLAAALMLQGYVEAVALGFRQANLCLIRDGNPSSKLDGGHSEILRRYELYQYPGSEL